MIHRIPRGRQKPRSTVLSSTAPRAKRTPRCSALPLARQATSSHEGNRDSSPSILFAARFSTGGEPKAPARICQFGSNKTTPINDSSGPQGSLPMVAPADAAPCGRPCIPTLCGRRRCFFGLFMLAGMGSGACTLHKMADACPLHKMAQTHPGRWLHKTRHAQLATSSSRPNSARVCPDLRRGAPSPTQPQPEQRPKIGHSWRACPRLISRRLCHRLRPSSSRPMPTQAQIWRACVAGFPPLASGPVAAWLCCASLRIYT